MLTRKIRELTLRRKMFLLLGLVVTGYMIVAISHYQTRIASQQAERAIRDADHLALLVKTTEALLLHCRKHEQDFQLDKREEQITAFDREAQALQSMLEETAPLATAFGMKQDIDTIRRLVGNYVDSFHALNRTQQVIGLDSRSGLRGKLRTAADDTEEVVKAQMQDDLMVLMVKLRYHEELFFARHAEEDIKKIRDLHSMFSSRLAFSEVPESSRAFVEKSMANYLESFTVLAEKILAADRDIASFHQHCRPQNRPCKPYCVSCRLLSNAQLHRSLLHNNAPTACLPACSWCRSLSSAHSPT